MAIQGYNRPKKETTDEYIFEPHSFNHGMNKRIIVWFKDGIFEKCSVPLDGTWDLSDWILLGDLSRFIQEKQDMYDREKEKENPE
jgi:hypothetical protein